MALSPPAQPDITVGDIAILGDGGHRDTLLVMEEGKRPFGSGARNILFSS